MKRQRYYDYVKDIYAGVKQANDACNETVIDINKTAFASDKVVKRANEQKKWEKKFKRRKSKLHRLVKKMRIWDYAYTEAIIIELVRINCEYYGNPDVVEFATDSEQYKELKAATDRLTVLADKIKSGSSDPEERESRKEFYTLLGKYIECFWE